MGVITAIAELLETEDGQDEIGLQRRQILKEMLSEFGEENSNHEIEKRDTDSAYVNRHVKQDSLGAVDSQDNYSKQGDKPDMGTYNDKEGEKVRKKDEQSHFKKLVDNINWPNVNIKPELCLDPIKMARFAPPAEDQAVVNTKGEEMPGLDEGTTYSKSLQEAGQVDNQPKDEGTAVDTGVLKRSVDMNAHTSSQETSRHGHPQYWVDIKRISDNQPYNEAESLPQQVKTGFHVWTGQHEVPVSVRQYRSLLRQVKTGPHVWTGRHGVSALVLRQALMSGQVDTGFQFCTLVKSL